jgi:Cu+-exporting ATPase
MASQSASIELAPLKLPTTDFRIEGMTCASCVSRVEKAIRAVPGVASANVNLATERATVAFSSQPDPQAVTAAIAKAGYATPEETVELQIEGMTCASCVARIEKALAAVPGVTSAAVNLATERAVVRFPDASVTRAALENAVRVSGYDVIKSPEDAKSDDTEERRAAEIGALGRALAVAATLTVPLFVMEMGSHYVPAIHMWIMTNIGMPTNLYIQFVLATVVLFGPGLRFFRKGIPNLLRRTPDMNSLVVLGTSAAWFYSIVSTFMP